MKSRFEIAFNNTMNPPKKNLINEKIETKDGFRIEIEDDLIELNSDQISIHMNLHPIGENFATIYNKNLSHAKNKAVIAIVEMATKIREFIEMANMPIRHIKVYFDPDYNNITFQTTLENGKKLIGETEELDEYYEQGNHFPSEPLIEALKTRIIPWYADKK